ncbi:uncharacterized protein LOC123528704 [Mercenaria mercenaria]|uniref:uncharacterized protein LOC123528704 n=1 Tax=Mercenaria mercenaria TaxID=6596 RepID=UPI00234E67BE|nr:uncharacterized protein LOC123528704 [Mercenaria mercenaria]
MDFSVLLKDLRDVAEKYQGKGTEPQVSTHAYVDMFTKILKRAQKVTEQYDDQITVLWVALNQLASIYKDLTAGSARDQLCKFIFGMCAKTVLNIQWAQLDDDSKVKKNFSTTVEDVHKILSQLGFYKFQLILDLMESHWTHPVLSKIMSGDEEDTDDCLEYIQKEDPDILKLRIEIMMKENCEEFALNLCDWSLKHPALQNDLKIKEHQIFILYKQQEYGKMQEVCETIICHDGIKVMSHLAKTPTNQELCIRLAQVFLIQDWVKPERTCCTQELLKLWIHHQYLADKDEERFLDSIWTVAKVCRDTEQIGVLIDGVKKECGDMFIQLYSELCKFAINIDKGNMEREEVQKDKEEYNKRRLAMSKTCVRMAFMLKEYDFRISRICGLTAFSLDPTMDNLNLVNKLYWTMKNVSAASRNSKINIATLYEIERLLGQMRPDSLNPELSWKQLIPVCKKYKQDYENDKNGIPIKQKVKNEHTAPQSATFERNNEVTPMTNMLNDVKSDKDVTKNIDTGQKRGRKPKNQIPKDIQKAHLAKLLGQKNLSRQEIEKVLSKEFPRNVTQGFSEAPSLDVKELDKTINDLKKSIYLETQYRERIKNNLSSLKHCKNRSEDKEAGAEQNQHVSRHEMYRQQQQMIHNKNAIQRQQSAQAGSPALGPILHRQLSMGSPQPPNAHSHHRQQQMSPAFGGSPPPAHSTSPRLSSPTGFSSPMSPPALRPHSACPTILNSRKSGAFSQMHTTSQNRSSTVSSQLCNKIKNELQQQSQQVKLMKNSKFNILRPPGNSKQECAKIAQQIAEMHERQRAERERADKLENARIQGQIDGVKAALNSRNIPSRSQISDLLSMTFQGNKGQKLVDGQNVTSMQGTDINQGKSYLKKKIERSASVSSVQNFASPESVRRSSVPMPSPNATSIGNPTYSCANQLSSSANSPSPSNRSHSTGRIPGVNHVSSTKESDSSMLVPGEQGWDPSRGIMKQKYYFKPPKDGTGKVNTGDSPLTMKPVYSMIVPKELTNPNRKEELVKTVTNMMKKFPKGVHSQQITSSSQTAQTPPTVVRVQSQSQTSSEERLSTDVVRQQLQNDTSPQHGLASQDGMQNASSMVDNQSNLQPVLAVSSQSVARNFLEDGLLNLNTLAAASVSVLGQNSNQQQLVGPLQLPQPVQQHQQQQQVFGTSVIESQPMFSQIQSVQQVVQQPETILATPLYTMPTTVIPEPVFSPQLASIQSQVDLGLQQPVVQQIIAVQNQPVAMNNTQSFVNVVSQQPAFQVATVEQVNFAGVTQSMTAGMSPSLSGGMTPNPHVTGNITNNVIEGVVQSVTGDISQDVSGEMIQSKMSNPVETLSPPGRPLTSKQFLAAPELSPALVQQILSSLKKGGTRSNKIKSQDGKQTTSKGQKQQSPVTNSTTHSSVKESVKDTVKQMIASRSDPAVNVSVNEARQKILELRKQFGQTASSPSELPQLSNVLPNKPVSASLSNTVVSPRKTGGLLARLMSDDQELNKVGNSVKNLPSFLSPSQSDRSITDNQTAARDSQPVIPELVDLGAKEFQLDSILALDNESSVAGDNALQNDQFSPANLAASGTEIVNETSSFVSQREPGLRGEQKHVSHGKGLQQPESSITAAPANTENICIENLQNKNDDKHQEYAPHCHSTYFNANRLGKERENRDVKNQHADSEETKLKVNSRQKVPAVCVSCNLQFPTEQHLLDHKKISNCDPKWQCAYCKMTFKCSEILKSHEKNYCLKAPSTMVKCCICGVYFQSREQLKAHLNPKTCTPQNIHKEKSELVEEIVCGICKRKFDSMNSIKEHVKAGCVKKDNTFSKESSLHNYNFSVAFKCTNCNFMNLNESIVSKHVEKCKENNATAELTKMYECNMCEETFCGKEDACRHVLRQCPKLKVTNSQKQVQDVYQKLKDGNASKVSSGESEKQVELKKKIQTGKEKVLNEGTEIKGKDSERTGLLKEANKTDRIDTCKNKRNVKKMNKEDVKTECNIPKISVEKATKGRVKVTAAGNRDEEKPIGKISEKVKCEDKLSTSGEVKSEDHSSMKTQPALSEDPIELAAQMQKVQRISAENKFFAEFNEIEKRKQAIRMKKQKELERQKEILERKEKEKEIELEKQKKIQKKLEEEKEKQKVLNEKQEKEKQDFKTEKEKYVNSILGTSTLEQKMKEDIEKEKKLKKIHSDKTKDGTVTVLNISRHERKGIPRQKSDTLDKVIVESKNAESAHSEMQQEDKKVAEYVINKKKRKKENIEDSEEEILPEEKRVLREHIETSERRKRQRDVLETENTEGMHVKMNKKQWSPQDIRKMRGLRAKRLIKKKKYYMDEMEPIHRDKSRKEEEQEERNQNIHGMKHKHQIDIKTDNKNVEKRENLLTTKKLVRTKSIEQEHTNKTKEDSKQIYRHLCRFCGLQNKIKSDRNLDVIYHYVKTHKVGFHQANYKYFCNFCNRNFPSTQTIQVKDHVCQNHWEGVLRRVSSGNYDTKVESTNNKSLSPAKTRYSLRVPVRTAAKSNKSKKHLRALALREKCAEKLRKIALTRKNCIINYSDFDEDSSVPLSSNHSTDTESLSREERIADVSAKIASISYGKKGNDTDLGPEIKDGRRIAPRLARRMVKGNKACSSEDVKKPSDIDDSSDTHVITRSRSSSASSSRSSLIASAKKRKAAIAISTKAASKSRQKQSDGGGKLFTRSGRTVKRPEMDYDKLTESSALGSGEDNSELEDTDIRKRKSTRIRRLSEKGKSLRGTISDTDESSTEEVKRRVTRHSLSKVQKENDDNVSDSQNLDEGKNMNGTKRIRTGQSHVHRLNSESVELRSLRKKISGKGRERVVKGERVITRQISKNEDESDSETESNYTDIEHAVKMLGLKRIQKAAIRSAESDSESTSEEGDSRDRKYRLRKRHLNKKYRESESSDEEVTKTKEKFKVKGDEVSDFEPSEECSDLFDDNTKTNKLVEEDSLVQRWPKISDKVKGKVNLRSDSSDFENDEEKTYSKAEKPKTVLIGPEDDDDLNVDYGLSKEKQDFYSNSHVNELSSENPGNTSEEHDDQSKVRGVDEVSNSDHDEIIDSKTRTVLIRPEDEFAGLETSPAKSLEREKSADSEIISKSVGESETEVESNILPATVMDEDEFEFLKNDQMLTGSQFGTNENHLNSSASSSSKAAFDSEFIKYAETKDQDDDTDSDAAFPQNFMERSPTSSEGRVEKDPRKEKLEIEIPPLAEDVPVLPPRDYFNDSKKSLKATFKNSEIREEMRNTKSLNTESQEMSRVKILKTARVVIEDISVVRKALEIENAERKLIEECEASDCSVRIDRLSKEEIEKHFPSSSNAANEKNEVEVILIDESDEENVITKDGKEHIERKNQNNALDKKIKKDDTETVNAVKEQYETLIQDIVLDGSFIDQLLISESVNEVHPVQPEKGKDACNLETTECVQIVVESSNSLQNSLIAVDAQCDTSAQSDANDEVSSNNVIVLIDDSEKGNVKKPHPDETESRKESEEEVWVENAETYAETPKDTENRENNTFKYTVVKSDDTEPINEPDYSDLSQHTIVLSSTDDTIESKQHGTVSQGDEIAVCSSDQCDKNNQKSGKILEKAEKSENIITDKADLLSSLVENKQTEKSSMKLTATAADNFTEDVKNRPVTINPNTQTEVRKQEHVLNRNDENRNTLGLDKENLQSQEVLSDVSMEQEMNPSVRSNIEAEVGAEQAGNNKETQQDDTDTTSHPSKNTDLNEELKIDEEQNETSGEVQTENDTGSGTETEVRKQDLVFSCNGGNNVSLEYVKEDLQRQEIQELNLNVRICVEAEVGDYDTEVTPQDINKQNDTKTTNSSVNFTDLNKLFKSGDQDQNEALGEVQSEIKAEANSETEIGKQDIISNPEIDDEVSFEFGKKDLQSQANICIEQELNPNVCTSVEAEVGVYDNEETLQDVNKRDVETMIPVSNFSDQNSTIKPNEKEWNETAGELQTEKQNKTAGEVQTKKSSGVDIQIECDSNSDNIGDMFEHFTSSQIQGQVEMEITPKGSYRAPIEVEKVIGTTVKNDLVSSVGPAETFIETSSPAMENGSEEKSVQNDHLREDMITHSDETRFPRQTDENQDGQNIESTNKDSSDLKETDKPLAVSDLTDLKYSKVEDENVVDSSKESFVIVEKSLNDETDVGKDKKLSILDVSPEDGQSKVEGKDDTPLESSTTEDIVPVEKNLISETDHGTDAGYHLEQEQNIKSKEDWKPINETAMQSAFSPQEKCYQEVDVFEAAADVSEKDLTSAEGNSDMTTKDDTLFSDLVQATSCYQSEESNDTSKLVATGDNNSKKDSITVYSIIQAVDQNSKEPEAAAKEKEETGSRERNNEQMNTEILIARSVECENKLFHVEPPSGSADVKSMTELNTNMDVSVDSADQNRSESKFDITTSENKVDICVPTDKETETEEPASFSGERLDAVASTPLFAKTEDTAVLVKTVERNKDEETVKGTEKECFSGYIQNMQKENISSVKQSTAKSDVSDHLTVCNENVGEEMDKSENISNSSLLALQSYSDSDSEEESENLMKVVKSTRITESSTCFGEVSQPDKQQSVESVTNTLHDINVQQLKIGEGESDVTEQLQNKKYLKPGVAESESVSVPLCVDSRFAGINESCEENNEIETFDNPVLVFQENEVHSTTCVKTENRPELVQNSNSVVAFDCDTVESAESVLMIKESETHHNEDESKTAVDADLCTEMVKNHWEHVYDYNSKTVVNFNSKTVENLDENEMKCNTDSYSERTVEEYKISSSDTETDTRFQQGAVQAECQEIIMEKQNEIYSNMKEKMRSETDVIEHIQHVDEIGQGSDTHEISEVKKDFENPTEVSDINVEDTDTSRETDFCSVLSVKKENRISVLDNTKSNEESTSIVNTETSHETDTLQTNEEHTLYRKIDPDENVPSLDLLKPELLQSYFSETDQGKSEGNADIVKSDLVLLEDNVPDSIQELHSVVSEENVSAGLIVQNTFEDEKESFGLLKVEFEQQKDNVESVNDADSEPENTWIVIDECSRSPGNDQVEIESKNPILRTVRQTSVSSSSDISLISFPEYETEHSEESNEKRENVIESVTAEVANSAVTDEVRDSENELSSKEESKPESYGTSEMEWIEPTPDEVSADTEKQNREKECSANSSYPLTRDNLITENVDGITKSLSSHNDEIKKVNCDESKNISVSFEVKNPGVNINSEKNEGINDINTAVPEMITKDTSDSSGNVLKETLVTIEGTTIDLCYMNKEKTEIKCSDSTDMIQKHKLKENTSYEVPSAGQVLSDEKFECDVESKNKNLKTVDSDSPIMNKSEAKDDSNIELQKITGTEGTHLNEMALNDTKKTEVSEEVCPTEDVLNVKELTSNIRKTRSRSREQSVEIESLHENKRQRKDSIENATEKKRLSRSRSKDLDDTEISHLSNKSIDERKQTSNGEKGALNKDKIVEQKEVSTVLDKSQTNKITDAKEASSNVIKIAIDEGGEKSVTGSVIHTNRSESKVPKDDSEKNTTNFKSSGKIDKETTKLETDHEKNTVLDYKESTLSQEIIESGEEDPTLDKWVKEIISKETEEKREVFEIPSPRRKGMIVGATCLHKKPENPFVDTRSFKKDGSLKKEANVGNQTGIKKVYIGKDKIVAIQNKNMRTLERKSVAQSERKSERSSRVEMSKSRAQNNLKPKTTKNVQKQSISGSRNKVSSKLSLEMDQREKKHTVNDAGVAAKDEPSNICRETKEKQTCPKGKDLSKKTDGNETLNISLEQFQDTECIASKTDDKNSGGQKRTLGEGSAKTEVVKAEMKAKLALPSECHISKESEILTKKSTDGLVDKDTNGNEVIQREDETDEEFRRRTETVRCARRKSSVKYEFDFDFEGNENNKKETNTKITPSTSFWPSESENNLESFDTASLFSSSSGSSVNTGGVKEGRLNVIARCARDFGKDESVKPKIIQLHVPRTSVPVFTCSSPEKTTVSTMAVKIVQTMGKSVVKTAPSPVKYPRQQCSNPVTASKIKVLDKNVLSNTLPARILKVTAYKSLPKISKSMTLTSSNIDKTVKKLTKQVNIGKKAPAEKHTQRSLIQKEKMKKLNEIKKLDSSTQLSFVGKTDENSLQEAFEPTDETLCNKGKALRALHKSHKPFKWENSPSPPKKLRSKTKNSENHSVGVPSSESTNTDKESKNKPETRKTREKSLNQDQIAAQKNVTENRKKGNDGSSKKANEKESISGKKKTAVEGRKTRQREPDTIEQDNVNLRRTRSRSGSKDNTKFNDEIFFNKLKEVTVRSKKQIQDKVDTKNSSAKTNENNSKTETRNTPVKNKKSPMKPRHDEREKDKLKETKNAEVGTNEIEDVKTRVQKRKSEGENVQKSKQTSGEEPATKVCKLDGTSNSPEKREIPKCAHKINIPGCDHCKGKQSENPKLGKEQVRPAVRQIIHRGRVFEIQRGCVTETDIQNFKRKPRSVVNEPSSTSGEDPTMKRSRRINERRKRAHSPEDIVDINMKDNTTEIGMQDINKYISQTLRDIKKQREGNTNSKWTVRQKKSTKEAFPYYFKKANAKL